MRTRFNWNNSPSNIVRRVTGGRQGMLFLANSAARFMDPYVPADNLVLAQNIDITADENCGHVTYNSPYAHYQYIGEVYGPNYPLMDGGEIMGFYSP